MVRNETAEIQALFQENVVPSYGRFDIVLSHGAGCQLWDVAGKRYLDLGGGIAVCSLGHAPAAITEALIEQSRKLVHTSNFYYHAPQGKAFPTPGKIQGLQLEAIPDGALIGNHQDAFPVCWRR